MNCPSCTAEFELELEKPELSHRKRSRRASEDELLSEIPAFPGICVAMSALIICFELLRIGFCFLLYKSLDELTLEILIEPRIKTVIMTLMWIMGVLAVAGLISSILVLSKSRAGLMASKIYIVMVLAGICYSFVNFNVKAITVNGVIALFLVISVIYYSSWWRQCDQLKRLARRRSRGEQSRRPAGRLKKRS